MDEGDVIYIMQQYSDMKNNEIMPFGATQIYLEIIILSCIRQKNIGYCLYMKSNKNDTNGFIYKTEIDSQIEKEKYCMIWLI